MAAPNMVILESDYERFIAVLGRLSEASNAKFVFLLDKAGQQIAFAGDLEAVDPTSLASLTAGNVAATEGVAQLVGEREFSTLYHEGRNDSLHITLVGKKFILLVVFDERSSLGLVRLRVEQALPELEEIAAEVLGRLDTAASSGANSAAFAEITEEDIDALFG